ncbi:PREDICTED: uncharacterized protein LOC101309313 isoform 1 [Fragaria vesca subsp. vesca]
METATSTSGTNGTDEATKKEQNERERNEDEQSKIKFKRKSKLKSYRQGGSNLFYALSDFGGDSEELSDFCTGFFIHIVDWCRIRCSKTVYLVIGGTRMKMSPRLPVTHEKYSLKLNSAKNCR